MPSPPINADREDAGWNPVEMATVSPEEQNSGAVNVIGIVKAKLLRMEKAPSVPENPD